mmetsp:Transcript_20482/g.32585  ORF Transcript_20482/g.32585 Transcript_20482/m.32585 type:complete len:420 (-) Transcript_20482:216-1475(-)
MDADSLSLLIILRQELKEIASSLQQEIIEDVMTDNGISLDDHGNHENHNNQLNNEHASSPPASLQEEDEKAQELRMHSESTPNPQMKSKQIGSRLNDLIENYLTPTIKQLNKKHKKKRKKASLEDSIYDSPSLMQSTHPLSTSFSPPSTSPSQSQSQSHSHASAHVRSLSEPKLLPSIQPQAHHDRVGESAAASSWRAEPGQVMDEMSNFSEKLGSCCRRFVTSLFCGCGVIQTGVMIAIFFSFVLVFVFYRASDLTLMLQEVNRWKELTVKRIEYELASEQKLAEIQFDLHVDIDKMKAEHQHREKMEIIEAKKLLTKEFIDRNTRTVTTTYWNFLTTETETVSQTIFSEDDVAFFQNNILYHGFNPERALQAPQEETAQRQIEEATMCDKHDSDICESPGIGSKAAASAQKDSFDSI